MEETVEKITVQINSLEKALARLKEAIGFEQSHIPARLNIDAAIQRFEFTYELAWKLMQSLTRYQGKDCQSPRDCFRLAAQMKLISNPLTWIGYLEARNLTVHTYDATTADQVYYTAKEFVLSTEALLVAAEKLLTSDIVS